MRKTLLSMFLLFILSACTPAVPDAERLLLFKSEDGTRIVDLADFAREEFIPDFGNIQSVSPDGSSIAVVADSANPGKHTLSFVQLAGRTGTVIDTADDFDADFLSGGRIFYQKWESAPQEYTYRVFNPATGESTSFDVTQCHEPDANPVYDYVACINGFWGTSTEHAEFNPGVAVYNLDGTVKYRLTTDDARSPYAWSNDGQVLAYGVPVGNGLFELWVVNMTDIRSARKIMGTTDFGWAGLVFNPDDSKIAFGYDEPKSSDHIGVVDIESGIVTEIGRGEQVIWLSDTTVATVQKGFLSEKLELIHIDHPILSRQGIYGGLERFRIFALPYTPED